MTDEVQLSCVVDSFIDVNISNPIVFLCFRRLIILSSPLNAPQAIKSMLVVSTRKVSPRNLRGLLTSGTLTSEPSNSFNIALKITKSKIFKRC
ncbi:unnamed protein product [Schistosoma mattheei]|uniref:Uncharacterized protein n=1 Tax=Schistosoma mattheei TaxID=31246 RepID=A0A3P8JDX0_9TREM|nr:unnamed protein product [Schistosoma mattheei]